VLHPEAIHLFSPPACMQPEHDNLSRWGARRSPRRRRAPPRHLQARQQRGGMPGRRRLRSWTPCRPMRESMQVPWLASCLHATGLAGVRLMGDGMLCSPHRSSRAG
jgi:hypothetical protein